jgi:hypothetical protein
MANKKNIIFVQMYHHHKLLDRIKKNILQRCVNTHPGRKRLKTSKYEKMESVLLEWFWQKLALYIPIQAPVLRQEAEEIALKLNISHLWMDDLINLESMQGLATEQWEENSKV